MVDINYPSSLRTAAAQGILDNRASEFAKHILKKIEIFGATLGETREVGIRLVSFGQTVTFHFDGIAYADPSLLSFSGQTGTGEPVELIQHVSQISIMLTTLPRRHPEKPKIGFRLAQMTDEDDQP